MKLFILKEGHYDGHYEMQDVIKFYSTIGGFTVETYYGENFFSWNDGYEFEMGDSLINE